MSASGGAAREDWKTLSSNRSLVFGLAAYSPTLCRRVLPASKQARAIPVFEQTALAAIKVIPALRGIYTAEHCAPVDQ